MSVRGGLFLLDTSIWVPVLRRREGKLSFEQRMATLVGEGLGATTGIVRLELARAARDEADYQALTFRLDGLHQLQTDRTVWEIAARMGWSLRRAGVVPRTADLIIAAAAVRWDVVLLHQDSDFDLIAAHSELRAENLS